MKRKVSKNQLKEIDPPENRDKTHTCFINIPNRILEKSNERNAHKKHWLS